MSTPIGMLALAICYDLRFPQLSTKQRLLGAQVLTYPSAFTVPTGRAHWEVFYFDFLTSLYNYNRCFYEQGPLKINVG